MVHTDTPCYSYHDKSSHFVHLPSSTAAQKAVAGRPSACRAQRSMKRVAAQGLAPGLVVPHRRLLVTQTATLFARRPQRRRHRAAHTSAPQDRRRGAKPREQSRGQPHDRPVTPLNDMHSRGAWPALSRFCEGGRTKSCFFALGGCPQGARSIGH